MDLAGRLSNPPPVVETLAGQGSARPQRPRSGGRDARNRATEGPPDVAPDQEGRLSNPVQRRLSKHHIDELVGAYLGGSSIDALAASLGVNRTTIISHLDHRGIERRKIVRKMTDETVAERARRPQLRGDSSDSPLRRSWQLPDRAPHAGQSMAARTDSGPTTKSRTMARLIPT